MIECIFKFNFEKFHNKILDDIENKFGLTLVKDDGLPTHITLKYPFQAKNIKELETTINKFTQNHSKAQLFATKFNNFNHNTIFIDIQASKKAKSIISQFNLCLKKILWIPRNEFEDNNLHLHSTVVMNSQNH